MQLVPITAADVQLGQPLPWPAYDKDRDLLLDAGEAVATPDLLELLLACSALRRQGAAGDDGLPAVPEAGGSGAADAEPGRECGFNEMGLRVGDRLQVQLPPQFKGEKVIVRVIGFVDGVSLLVTAPVLAGRAVPLLEEDRLLVRFFSGRHAYSFVSYVERVCRRPLDYLHLSYPGRLHAVAVRKARRARAQLFAGVRCGAAAEPVPALIRDLSVSGAGLLACRDLGQPGDTLQVSFTLRLEDGTRSVDAGAVVRSAYRDAASGKLHSGVEFADLADDVRLAIRSFVLERLYRDPSSLV